MKDIFSRKEKKSAWRLTIWVITLLACVLFSVLVWKNASVIYREYRQEQCFAAGDQVYELAPGSTMEQSFWAQGKSAGEMFGLQMQLWRQTGAEGLLQVRLYDDYSETPILDCTKDFSEILSRTDFKNALSEETEENPLSWNTIAEDGFFYLLKSGQKYRFEIVNQSESDSVYILGNKTIQSGKLLLDGVPQGGFLNLRYCRQSVYQPSVLLLLMILLTDVTVLAGLALALFTDVKTEILYLVLAVGFGIVTLFDLTPIYGFDMRFQFDSAYVLSNRILGVEDIVYTPSVKDPERMVASYYRRACDDYSQYQFYYHDEVSANYTDMKTGLRYPFATAEQKELKLVETDLGFVESQLYLCLPQAMGFAAARLLGLGMYPMLQAARVASYAVFVLCVVLAIRAIPFGKRLMMVLGLMPAVLIQEVSISRDAMIIAMSFLLIALILKLHYQQQKPKWSQWLPVLILAVLLAPCKMVYLPVSCLCLMPAYKHYILPAGKNGKKITAIAFAVCAAAAAGFVAMNYRLIREILFADTISLYGTPAYSTGMLLADPVRTVYVFGNTLRNQLGELLVNAVQLFNIHLGASDGVTLIIVSLLLLESCCADTEYRPHWTDRSCMLLMAAGTFLLLVLAAFRWTPVEMDIFIGLQGRYLIPILPLILLAWYNNPIVRINREAAIVTRIGCCLYPAVALMNMYLWTIQQ